MNMTAHIILTTLSLLLFVISLWIILKKDKNIFPWKLLTLMLFLILPLSFHGLTVIAHFLFVSSSESLLEYSLIYLPLLFLSGFYLQKIKKKKLFENNIFRISLFVIFIVFFIWYIFAITQSQYEKGTPFLTQNWQTICYWASIQVYLITLFILNFNFLLKNRKKYFSIFVVFVLMAIYLAIILNTFFGVF